MPCKHHHWLNYQSGHFLHDLSWQRNTVYPKKYAHGFVVVMQSFIINSHEGFIYIHQGCFAGTGAIVRLPQWQWRKPDGYGKISQCITTTKHSKAKTVCIFLGIYCIPLYVHDCECCQALTRRLFKNRTDRRIRRIPTWHSLRCVPHC